MTSKRDFVFTFNPNEQLLGEPNPVTLQSEPDPLSETPHRASAVIPRISELLERVEGIQRWGLNE